MERFIGVWGSQSVLLLDNDVSLFPRVEELEHETRSGLTDDEATTSSSPPSSSRSSVDRGWIEAND